MSQERINNRLIVKVSPLVEDNDFRAVLCELDPRIVVDYLYMGFFTYILEVPEERLKELHALLSDHPDVMFVEYDYIATPYLVPDDSYWSTQVYSRNIEIDKAWDITIGSPDIKVLVCDYGFDSTHPDLVDNIHSSVADDGLFAGHGTSVAGIVAATGNNATGVIGVAHGCKLVLKSGASTSAVIQALAEADGQTKVVNLSLGLFYTEALNNAVLAFDGVVCLAAGNDGQYIDGTGELSYLFNTSDAAVTVGACNHAAEPPTGEINYSHRATYSNYGPLVDIAAPSGIVTTRNRTVPLTASYQMVFSGTSGATPVVAGVCALIYSINPDLTPAQVRSILIATGDPNTGEIGPKVNAYRACRAARQTLPAYVDDVYLELITGPPNISTTAHLGDITVSSRVTANTLPTSIDILLNGDVIASVSGAETLEAELDTSLLPAGDFTVCAESIVDGAPYNDEQVIPLTKISVSPTPGTFLPAGIEVTLSIEPMAGVTLITYVDGGAPQANFYFEDEVGEAPPFSFLTFTPVATSNGFIEFLFEWADQDYNYYYETVSYRTETLSAGFSTGDTMSDTFKARMAALTSTSATRYKMTLHAGASRPTTATAAYAATGLGELATTASYTTGGAGLTGGIQLNSTLTDDDLTFTDVDIITDAGETLAPDTWATWDTLTSNGLVNVSTVDPALSASNGGTLRINFNATSTVNFAITEV